MNEFVIFSFFFKDIYQISYKKEYEELKSIDNFHALNANFDEFDPTELLRIIDRLERRERCVFPKSS